MRASGYLRQKTRIEMVKNEMLEVRSRFHFGDISKEIYMDEMRDLEEDLLSMMAELGAMRAELKTS